MRKNYRKLVTIMLAFVILFAMYIPAAADETITVSVKIRTTAMNGGVLVSNNNVVLTKTGTTNPTAMDALKAVCGGTTVSSNTINGTTYYTQGILKWYTTTWGDYICAVQVADHSSTNRFFGNNGAASSWNGSSQNAYSYLAYLNGTEYSLGRATNSTFNNTVHESGYLSETDYNNYSGWMTIINGSNNNNGVSTVLNNGDTIDLNFSMMMGLDLGQNSWMQNSQGTWVQCNKWNTYSFTNNTF